MDCWSLLLWVVVRCDISETGLSLGRERALVECETGARELGIELVPPESTETSSDISDIMVVCVAAKSLYDMLKRRSNRNMHQNSRVEIINAVYAVRVSSATKVAVGRGFVARLGLGLVLRRRETQYLLSRLRRAEWTVWGTTSSHASSSPLLHLCGALEFGYELDDLWCRYLFSGGIAVCLGLGAVEQGVRVLGIVLGRGGAGSLDIDLGDGNVGSGEALGSGGALARDAETQAARTAAHDGLGVSQLCGGEACGTLGLVLADLGAGGCGELWPALGVCEGGMGDVWVRGVGGVEGDDAGAVDVVDLFEVGEADGVDEKAGGVSGGRREKRTTATHSVSLMMDMQRRLFGAVGPHHVGLESLCLELAATASAMVATPAKRHAERPPDGERPTKKLAASSPEEGELRRALRDEKKAYGRDFRGCGRQSDYDLTTKLGEGTFGSVFSLPPFPPLIFCQRGPQGHREAHRRCRGAQAHTDAQREGGHARHCPPRNQDPQSPRPSLHRQHPRHVCRPK